MKQFWIFTAVILLTLLVIFILFEQAALSFLSRPETFMERQSLSVALVAIGMLIADVFLPVPSSLIMITSGAVFGAIMGTLVSLAGSIGATMVAFLIGRQSRSWVIDRFISTEQMVQAEQMVAQWGMVALIMTRPIPLLAETTAIVAGTSGMSTREVFIAALVGSLPVAVLYALIGSVALQFNNALWSSGLVIAIAVLFWGVPISKKLIAPTWVK